MSPEQDKSSGRSANFSLWTGIFWGGASKNHRLLTLLLADDHIVTSNPEDNLQKAVYKLNQIITEHGLSTSAQKKKTVGV